MSDNYSNRDESNVEKYEFEPIKGYPMLNWKGKRPFRSTQYFPAQLKETHGEPVNGWLNKIFWGDNLQVMSHLLKEFRGKVDLIYIDPPYDSKADYKKIIELQGERYIGEYNAFEEKQYTDIWTNDSYLQFMYERLTLLKELLSETGSIYVHLNHEKVHEIRCIMDEIFGRDAFKNDIIWKHAPGKSHSKYFGRVKDTILFYTKSSNYTWNTQYGELSEAYKATFNKEDEKGRYVTQPLHSGKPAKNVPVWHGIKPPEGRGWAYKIETLDQYENEGKIEWSNEGIPRLKRYLHEVKGTVIQDVWDDISPIHFRSNNSNKYPTEKPEALLERIIKSSSNPGDLVFDCFMGSGTTQTVALKNNRNFIGTDINLGAIQTTTKRLLNVMRDPNFNGAGFEVYNVNNYEVFRNPVQAKELLKEALEIQPLSYNSLYDGEKDGRMVKIMPINRIATKADLNDLISNFDYKSFEKRQLEYPNQPVERLLLVCMGHEPDLAAALEQEVNYKLDIEVVDILRDKSHLEFRRDSEADISIKEGHIVINNFFPMNLLQKLSIMKENVEDWKELTESVMIDWNYDGAVLEPSIVDIPGKNETVKGKYKIPKDAGTIRVKITDLLSESLEVSVKNG